MKTKTIILIIGLILLTSVTGLSVNEAINSRYDTRQDAITGLRTVIRPERAAELTASVPIILKYVSDKICSPDFDTEEITCRLCFEYNYTVRDEMLEESRCISVPEGTTPRQDDTSVKAYVDKFITGLIENLESDRADYVDGAYSGRRIDYDSSR